MSECAERVFLLDAFNLPQNTSVEDLQRIILESSRLWFRERARKMERFPNG